MQFAECGVLGFFSEPDIARNLAVFKGVVTDECFSSPSFLLNFEQARGGRAFANVGSFQLRRSWCRFQFRPRAKGE